MGTPSKTKVKIAPPSNYMKSTVDPSEYDKTSNLYGRQNSGSTAAQTTQKKRSFKSTKQRIQAERGSEQKPLQAPIDEIGESMGAGMARDS